ncbi:hypothetical protein Ancab_028655 [Ancistrocladus abbreviatus]
MSFLSRHSRVEVLEDTPAGHWHARAIELPTQNVQNAPNNPVFDDHPLTLLSLLPFGNLGIFSSLDSFSKICVFRQTNHCLPLILLPSPFNLRQQAQTTETSLSLIHPSIK